MRRVYDNDSLARITRVGMTALLTGLMVAMVSNHDVLGQSGGDYEIRWSTIDGGGGRSTGGDYALTGTIGQPDAGEMAGGGYTLSGGFWPGGPLFSCFVNFEHFAQFAMYWLDAPCDAGNDWCGGADLDYSYDVGLSDIGELAYFWLAECPEDWPWE